MAGRLIMLPLRVSARLFLRAAEEVSGRAISGALKVAGAFSRDGSAGPGRPSPAGAYEQAPPQPARQPRSPATETARPMTVPAKSASATVERRAEVAPEGAQTATPVEPAHVSEQPELVRETAEPGAEEGAGAAVTVREPWDGYRQLSAKEVIARIADGTPAELAVVQLYESANRSRQTVLEAARRQLRTANGRGSQA
jgi:hypothetical protein